MEHCILGIQWKSGSSRQPLPPSSPLLDLVREGKKRKSGDPALLPLPFTGTCVRSRASGDVRPFECSHRDLKPEIRPESATSSNQVYVSTAAARCPRYHIVLPMTLFSTDWISAWIMFRADILSSGRKCHIFWAWGPHPDAWLCFSEV